MITQAIEREDHDVLKLLVDRGADANVVDSECRLPPLLQALSQRREEIARQLMEAGALVSTQALDEGYRVSKGQTALILAASCRLRTSVRLLLERGASVDDVDLFQKTALMHAFEWYDENEDSTEDDLKPGRDFDAEVVRLLLNAESTIDAQSVSGETALMMAVQNDAYEEAVGMLLFAGASVHLVDKINWTALMHAASNRSIKMMKLLLDASSPVDTQSHTGETALMILSDSDVNYELVKLLLDHGAKTEMSDNHGWTPLLIAAYNGQYDVVQILLKHGASVRAESIDGDCAVVLARLGGFEAVVSLLQNDEVHVTAQQTMKTKMPRSLSCNILQNRVEASGTVEWA